MALRPCRWAEASGFDGVTVETETMREVIMLCCAIKPLCAWNGQVGLLPAHCDMLPVVGCAAYSESAAGVDVLQWVDVRVCPMLDNGL